jgi:hypothetical protein
VGYRFETSRFVVASVVPACESTPEELANLLKTTKKLHAFDTYCASEPQVLGIIEAKPLIGKRIDGLKRTAKGFLQVTMDAKQSLTGVEVFSRGQLQAVTTHIVHYPRLAEGEFLSVTAMNFADVIERSREWDLKSPYIQGNELFTTTDLTESDIAVRMINCSKILERLLRTKCLPDAPFIFEQDFYGRKHYWFSIALPLKLIALLYLLIYVPYRLCIAVLNLFSLLDKLNTMLQLSRKQQNF